MKNKFSLAFLNEKLSAPWMAVFSSIIAMGIAFLIPALGVKFGIVIIILIVGIPLLILSLVNIKAGLLVLFVYTSFSFFIARVFKPNFPMGTVSEMLFLPLILGIILRRPRINVNTWFNTPIILIIIIWFSYLLLEAVNPGGSFAGWFFGFRLELRLLFTFIIAYYAFDSLKFLKTFIIVWLIIAMITSLYGYYQEFVGLPSFDMAWATETIQRKNLLFIGGHWRKWSILSGGNDFGIFMAMSSLFCFIMAMGSYKPVKRFFLSVAGLIMMVSISFSGTRTANAMFVVGVVFFILMTLDSKRSMIVAVLFSIFFMLILFVTISKWHHQANPVYFPTKHRSLVYGS